MPMNKPAFTTNADRIARLQENYNEGAQREKMRTEDREKRDMYSLHVSREKLLFLFQNAMESYSKSVKNQKVKDYNEGYIATAVRSSHSHGAKSRFRFL